MAEKLNPDVALALDMGRCAQDKHQPFRPAGKLNGYIECRTCGADISGSLQAALVLMYDEASRDRSCTS